MAVDRLQKCIQLLAAGAERRRKILGRRPVLGQHRPSGAAQGVIRIAALPLPAGPPARAVLANRLRRSVEDLRRIRVGILHGGGCQDGIVQPQERIGRHLQLRAQPLLLCCAAGMRQESQSRHRQRRNGCCCRGEQAHLRRRLTQQPGKGRA